MRPGNRSGKSPSLQNIEGAQNLRKACRAFEVKQFTEKTAAADASEWQGGAQDMAAHRTHGHWSCSTQIGFGKPRVPGVAAQVVEDGTTQ